MEESHSDITPLMTQILCETNTILPYKPLDSPALSKPTTESIVLNNLNTFVTKISKNEQIIVTYCTSILENNLLILNLNIYDCCIMKIDAIRGLDIIFLVCWIYPCGKS